MSWERGPSPAAAAWVSRSLSEAGITKAVEIAKGVEMDGYAVELQPDHIRVEYVSLWDDPKVVINGLHECQVALSVRGYKVERVTTQIPKAGGWTEGEILKVTK